MCLSMLQRRSSFCARMRAPISPPAPHMYAFMYTFLNILGFVFSLLCLKGEIIAPWQISIFGHLSWGCELRILACPTMFSYVCILRSPHRDFPSDLLVSQLVNCTWCVLCSLNIREPQVHSLSIFITLNRIHSHPILYRLWVSRVVRNYFVHFGGSSICASVQKTNHHNILSSHLGVALSWGRDPPPLHISCVAGPYRTQFHINFVTYLLW